MKKFYESIDLKTNEMVNVEKMQLLQDASGDDEAVRKLQAETLAALAVQAKIVQNAAQASADNSLSATYMVNALGTKQPNLAIDASSSAYLEIVDGYKLKLKDLGILGTHKDLSSGTLAAFIAASTYNGDGTIEAPNGDTLDSMTFIFLEAADNPSEKSFIYLGTNLESADDFVSFSVDYNSSEIRSFFTATGTGLSYSASTGIYSLDLGNSAGKLGAHTTPIDSNEFSTINGSTVLAVLKALESLIASSGSAQATATTQVDDRVSSCTGATGSNMGSFTGSTFDADKNIKELIQQAETLIEQATADRAAIAAAAAAATGVVQSDLTAEASARALADNSLASDIASEAASRAAADGSLSYVMAQNAVQRVTADNALDARLDVVEGSAAGSIAKAEADAIAAAAAHTHTHVDNEQARAEAAEAALNTKIDNLEEGDLRFLGTVAAAGIIGMRAAMIAVETPSSRNGLALKDVYHNAGEIWVMAADQTITFDDSSSLLLQNGDRLMATEDCVAGAATAASFNVVQADASALSVANVDDTRIELNGTNDLDIVADSIDRPQLSVAVRAELDDTRSLTADNAMTSDADTHIVISTDFGAQQNMHYKRTQSGSAALTGTVRTTLTELHINSDGSGNPLAPSYAHSQTSATHYNGSCLDNSVVIAGANFEANGKAGAAVQATGAYCSAMSENLGINIGLTAVADNGASSNVGITAFSGAQGSGKDRGLVACVGSADILTYGAQRAADPFPFNDICLVADAKYSPAGTRAFYAYGDCKFEGGAVEVAQAPTTADSVMRLSDTTDKQKAFRMDLTDATPKTFTCSLDLDKCIIQAVHGDDDIEVKVERDPANSQLTVTAFGGSLTACKLIVQEMTCDYTDV